MKKLRTHIKLKERMITKRRQKFENLYHAYIQKQEKEDKEKYMKTFLTKREKVVVDICDRLYEEERRKVEEELMNVCL